MSNDAGKANTTHGDTKYLDQDVCEGSHSRKKGSDLKLALGRCHISVWPHHTIDTTCACSEKMIINLVRRGSEREDRQG
jgi:hypothetical protein